MNYQQIEDDNNSSTNENGGRNNNTVHEVKQCLIMPLQTSCILNLVSIENKRTNKFVPIV